MYKELWTASCILLVFGFLGTVGGSLLKYFSKKNEVLKGSAEARVVDIVPEPRRGTASLSEFHNRQAAVFEFYAGGRLVKVMDHADTYPCPYRLNQRVQIRYDVDDPENFYVKEKDKMDKISTGINIVSMCFIIAGCVLFLVYAAGIQF